MIELKSIINLTGNRARYVKSREDLAKDIMLRANGKMFFYNIPDISTDIGLCYIKDITYDKLFDTFIYTIVDYNTNSIIVIDRCHISLISIH